MGTDKAMLRREGRTLLDAALHTVSEALKRVERGPSPVWVSGARHGYPCVVDRVPGRGPLGGIDAALARFRGARLLVVPVDMPLLTQGLLVQLLEVSTERPAVQFEGHELPMLLVGTDEVARVVEELLRGEDTRAASVRGLLERLGAEKVAWPVEQAHALVNVNAPDEWARVNGSGP